MQTITVKALYQLIKDVKPTRFNGHSKEFNTFEHSTLTKGYKVNLYTLYRVTLALKETKVNDVNFVVNGETCSIEISSFDHNFNYSIPFKGE